MYGPRDGDSAAKPWDRNKALALARHRALLKQKKRLRHLPYGAKARSVNGSGDPVFKGFKGGPDKRSSYS